MSLSPRKFLGVWWRVGALLRGTFGRNECQQLEFWSQGGPQGHARIYPDQGSPWHSPKRAYRRRRPDRLAGEAGERLARDNTGGRSFLKLYSARQVGRSPRACGPQDRAGGASTPRPELTGSHRAVNDDQISDRTVQPQRDYFVDTRLIWRGTRSRPAFKNEGQRSTT